MSQENKKNTKRLIIGAAILALAVIALAVVYVLCRPKPDSSKKTNQGAKTVTIEVVDNQKNKKSYEVHTDADYLRKAMEEAPGLKFSGTEGQYGLMVETVNGVTADYSKDQSYWAFYVNGEYCQYGVDEQVVHDGDVFTIEYTGNTQEQSEPTIEPTPEPTVTPEPTPEPVKTGAKAIVIEVVDSAKEKKVYKIQTDADYLRQAMEEAGDVGLTFSGTEGQYGLMVETVNGLTADYSVDQSYWGFYVNGEYCQYGVDEQIVTDGDVFTIAYTISEW